MSTLEEKMAGVVERLRKLETLPKELEEAELDEVLVLATRHLAHMHSATHFFFAYPSQAFKQEILSDLLASAMLTSPEDLCPLLQEALERMAAFVQDLIPERRSDA